jgi:hypothetical protein
MIPDLKLLGKQFWLDNDFSYAGWIPNVSGQISFSIIGSGSHVEGVSSYNDMLDDVRRIIVVHQKRYSKDFPFTPEWYLKRKRPNSGIDYFLFAETVSADIPIIARETGNAMATVDHAENAQGALSGSIFLMLYQGQSIKRTKSDTLADEVRQLIANWQGLTPTEVQAAIRKKLASEDTVELNILRANFALFRTGELRIWFGATFGTRIKNDDEFARLRPQFAKQAFYFIKDIVHRHYHHDAESDQFVALTDIKQENLSHEDGEVAWRRNTLWGLARVIMQYRRAGRWHQLNKAVGVLAYAEAFQRGFAQVIRSKIYGKIFEPIDRIHRYDFAQLRASIAASVEENQFRRTAAWQGLTLALATIFSLFALWASSATSVRSYCDKMKTDTLLETLNCNVPIPKSMILGQAFVVNNIVMLSLIVGMAIWFLQHWILRDRPPVEFWPIRVFDNAAKPVSDLLVAIMLDVVTFIKKKSFFRWLSEPFLKGSIYFLLVTIPPAIIISLWVYFA